MRSLIFGFSGTFFLCLFRLCTNWFSCFFYVAKCRMRDDDTRKRKTLRDGDDDDENIGLSMHVPLLNFDVSRFSLLVLRHPIVPTLLCFLFLSSKNKRIVRKIAKRARAYAHTHEHSFQFPKRPSFVHPLVQSKQIRNNRRRRRQPTTAQREEQRKKQAQIEATNNQSIVNDFFSLLSLNLNICRWRKIKEFQSRDKWNQNVCGIFFLLQSLRFFVRQFFSLRRCRCFCFSAFFCFQFRLFFSHSKMIDSKFFFFTKFCANNSRADKCNFRTARKKDYTIAIACIVVNDCYTLTVNACHGCRIVMT